MIQLPWLFVQLVAWLSAMLLLVGAFAFLVLSPPYFAGKYLWRRFHTH